MLEVREKIVGFVVQLQHTFNHDKLFTIDNEEGYEITHRKNAVKGNIYQNDSYSQSREYNGTNIVCNNTRTDCPKDTQWIVNIVHINVLVKVVEIIIIKEDLKKSH